MKLWEELAGHGRTFLLENFDYKLQLICKHVAHSEMQKSGDWRRKGVAKPTRIPRNEMESLQAAQDNAGDLSYGPQAVDVRAQDAFDLAEYSDLFDEARKLPAYMRKILYDRIVHDKTQAEIAAEMGVTDRTIRNYLKATLEELRRRYQGGEEETHV